MKQLSGLDASFLYLETGSQFGHVSSLSIYAKPADDADYDPFAAWRAQIERRLHLLEPRRRHEALAQRRHPEIDDTQLERSAARPARRTRLAGGTLPSFHRAQRNAARQLR